MHSASLNLLSYPSTNHHHFLGLVVVGPQNIYPIFPPSPSVHLREMLFVKYTFLPLFPHEQHWKRGSDSTSRRDRSSTCIFFSVVTISLILSPSSIYSASSSSTLNQNNNNIEEHQVRLDFHYDYDQFSNEIPNEVPIYSHLVSSIPSAAARGTTLLSSSLLPQSLKDLDPDHSSGTNTTTSGTRTTTTKLLTQITPLQDPRSQQSSPFLPRPIFSFDERITRTPWDSSSSSILSINDPEGHEYKLSSSSFTKKSPPSKYEEDHLLRRLQEVGSKQLPLAVERLQSSSSHLTKRQQVDTGSTDAQYFPQPFDTSLGTEFESDTCQPFMSKFLNNPGFQDCHPFSLLLTTSQTFFRAYSSLNPSNNINNGDGMVAISNIMPVHQVIQASCRADMNKCANLLDQLALSINSTTIGCGKDLGKQNSLPLQALDGLKNYKLMREVACLTTDSTDNITTAGSSDQRGVQNLTNITNATLNHGSLNISSSRNSTLSLPTRYCFEKAVSNDRPDDLYYYYLPLGTGLPSGTQSSCDQCIRSIMKLYSIDASNNSLALSRTYLSARTMTNSQCGPGFAPLPINMANRLASSAPRGRGGPSSSPLISPFTFVPWLFIFIFIFYFSI